MTLVVEGLCVSFGGRVVLDDLSLQVAPGRVLGVLGTSGTGKSTLLACLAGLRLPDAGVVRIGQTEVTKLSSRARAHLRLTEIGFVYQSGDLLPELDPVENVMLPGLLAGEDSAVVRERAESLMGELAVRTEAQTAQLSGGEAQRLALARALISSPSVLLADEPTGSLDANTRDAVLDLMWERVERDNLTAIVVTHDPAVAQRADETLVLTAVPATV